MSSPLQSELLEYFKGKKEGVVIINENREDSSACEDLLNVHFFNIPFMEIIQNDQTFVKPLFKIIEEFSGNDSEMIKEEDLQTEEQLEKPNELSNILQIYTAIKHT